MQNLKKIFRYLRTNRKYTILNIIGLSLGMVLTIMMVMLIYYELSFDAFHPEKNNIYKICRKDIKSGIIDDKTPCPTSKTIASDFPEIKHVVGIYKIGANEVKYNNISYTGFHSASVEADIFTIFDYKLILGTPEKVIDDANKIAISQRVASKIFGSENPVGKILTINNYSFTISGLYKDVPKNSDVGFDILFSDKIRKLQWDKFPVAWWASSLNTYVIPQSETSMDLFNSHLAKIPDNYYPAFLEKTETYFAEPFVGIRFNECIPGGVSVVYLFTLASIAFITLLIACFNFINLTISGSVKRGKEMSMRKILGAGRNKIIASHIQESLIQVSFSTIVAAFLYYLLLPVFDKLTERPISDHFYNPVVIIVVIAIVLLTGLITGLVPGLYYTKIAAIKVLKSKSKGQAKAVGRNISIIAQFVVAGLLVISQFFIMKQINYMQNADLGFDNNNLISINMAIIDAPENELYTKVIRYKKELEEYRDAYSYEKGALTENIPGFYYQNYFRVKPVNGEIDDCGVISTSIDEEYLNVFDIKLVDGRFFSDEIYSDKNSLLINQTLMKKIGWDRIDGKYMRLSHQDKALPVIGVINDVHQGSLKDAIKPMIYRFGNHNNFPGFLTFRINNGNEKEVIDLMQAKWKDIFPEVPFIHFSVKEKYFENYTEEKRLAKIIGSFALLSIILSTLGLFGLISFFTEQRTKEIGIRKVNGAKIHEILVLLNKNFFKLSLISLAISWPIGCYIAKKWLEGFAYKTEISWWIFAASGAIVLIIAILTVSWQSWRAANRNPVEALRYE